MRILLLITEFSRGGALRVFRDQFCAFSSKYSVDQAVFSTADNDTGSDSRLPHVLDRGTYFSYLGSVGRLLKRSIALNMLVRAQKYDVVISHMDGANWVNALSCSVAKKVLVVHGTVKHDRDTRSLVTLLRRWFIFPLLYNRAEKTIAVSDAIACELRSFGVKRVSSIPNFFRVNQIEKMAAEPLTANDASIFEHPHVMVTSGRLAEQKQQMQLIELQARLKARHVSARLVVLGDGPLREQLIQRARSLNLTVFCTRDHGMSPADAADVYFLGWVKNPYKYLSKSTLFLFPSAWEGFPLALCEAMICRVAALSSDCPTGPREILAPGTRNSRYNLRNIEVAKNGVLLPIIQSDHDLCRWADATEMLLNDECLRDEITRSAAKQVKSLEWTLGVEKWVEMLEELVEPK
jgi:glycosyltransferase involved in cell wall biosynthesis